MNALYPYNKISEQYLGNVASKVLNGRLIVLEERFLFAHLCWRRLHNRSNRYNEVLNLCEPKEILVNPKLRELHADEHFFFLTCGDIYKDIQHQIRNSVFTISTELMEKLKALKEERRVHTHGADWYWGKVDQRNPPVPTKGDNYDFDRNMLLLNNIYSEIVNSLKNNIKCICGEASKR